jgi:uncharacterized membrane protein YiaA
MVVLVAVIAVTSRKRTAELVPLGRVTAVAVLCRTVFLAAVAVAVLALAAVTVVAARPILRLLAMAVSVFRQASTAQQRSALVVAAGPTVPVLLAEQEAMVAVAEAPILR